MKAYIKDLFARTNERLHPRIRNRLQDPEYRAQLMVNDLLGQLAKCMDHEGISRSELARRVGVDRSSVTQLFGSDGSVSLSTLFRYLDAVDLTIEHPSITRLDAEEIYKEYGREREAVGQPE